MEERRADANRLCTEVELLRQSHDRLVEVLEGGPGKVGFIPEFTRRLTDLERWKDIRDFENAREERVKVKMMALVAASITLFTAVVHFVVDYIWKPQMR